MNLNPADRSSYFKGLLTLFLDGENVSQYGKELIKEIGSILGFNHNFVQNTLNSFLENKYIVKETPQFSNCEFAEIFLKDGMRIAFLEKVINFKQIEFLTLTAMKNNLSKQWVFIELENILENQNFNFNTSFEIQKYLNVDYNNNLFLSLNSKSIHDQNSKE